MLSGDFLMDLARHIQSGLELTKERILSQAENSDSDDEDFSPVDSLSVRSETFATAVAKLFREKDVSEQDLAERIGCHTEDVTGLRRKGASHPSKELVTVLCLALQLTPDEARQLFHSARYTLVDYEVFDIVLMYCLEKGVFTLAELNAALECFNIKKISRQAVVTEMDRRVWGIGKFGRSGKSQ